MSKLPNPPQVIVTKNFKLFELLNGNRPVSKAYVNFLMESMKEKLQTTILIINEKNQIIDGQHRFMALKALNYPMYCIVASGYGLSEVHRYNTGQHNWSLTNYMDSYADKCNMEQYKIYKYFKKKWDIGHKECIALLSGTRLPGRKVMKAFKTGRFKVKALKEAEEIMKKINDIWKKLPDDKPFKNKRFIMAMTTIIKENFEYNHSQMVRKISYQSEKLKPQTRERDYLLSLEKIYNYKNRGIHLRFDIPIEKQPAHNRTIMRGRM